MISYTQECKCRLQDIDKSTGLHYHPLIQKSASVQSLKKYGASKFFQLNFATKLQLDFSESSDFNV